MLLVADRRYGVRIAAPKLSDHVRARLHARRLDERLANGADPDTDVLTALHAARLVGRHERNRLADALAHGLLASFQLNPPIVPATVTNRRAVAAAGAEILDLCARLRSDRPVSVRGVAFVRTLLTDGCGPFYAGAAGTSLRAAVRHGTQLLDAQ